MPYKHIPVMQSEVVYFLNCRPGKIYVDCTLGGLGHAKAVLRKISPGGLLIGIDQDKDAIKNAEKDLKSYGQNIKLFHENFVNFPAILLQENIAAVDGILLDLGISLHHLESSGRGFSFRGDEPLDMRMNIESDITAEYIINEMSEKNLVKIFRNYSQERWSKQIAKKIVETRKYQRIKTSKDLVQIICNAVPRKAWYGQRIHPATRIFMALRIAVNREIECLSNFMQNFADFLKPKGRLCVLSFHSLEDRIVKQRIKELEKECICPPDFPQCICNTKRIVRSLTKKAVRPTEKEVAANPMARSAQLRAVEKIGIF